MEKSLARDRPRERILAAGRLLESWLKISRYAKMIGHGRYGSRRQSLDIGQSAEELDFLLDLSLLPVLQQLNKVVFFQSRELAVLLANNRGGALFG